MALVRSLDKYKITINGTDISNWNTYEYSGADYDITVPYALSSGSASQFYLITSSGGLFDSYRHAMNEDLWRCKGCGAVHRVKDTLECVKCGMFITEESRFVLK